MLEGVLIVATIGLTFLVGLMLAQVRAMNVRLTQAEDAARTLRDALTHLGTALAAMLNEIQRQKSVLDQRETYADQTYVKKNDLN